MPPRSVSRPHSPQPGPLRTRRELARSEVSSPTWGALCHRAGETDRTAAPGPISWNCRRGQLRKPVLHADSNPRRTERKRVTTGLAPSAARPKTASASPRLPRLRRRERSNATSSKTRAPTLRFSRRRRWSASPRSDRGPAGEIRNKSRPRHWQLPTPLTVSALSLFPCLLLSRTYQARHPPHDSQSRGRVSALRTVPQEWSHVGTSRLLHRRTVVDDRYETGRGPFAGLEQVDVDVERFEKRRRLEHERWIQQVRALSLPRKHTLVRVKRITGPRRPTAARRPTQEIWISPKSYPSDPISTRNRRSWSRCSRWVQEVGQSKSQRPLHFGLTRLSLLRNPP